MEQTTVGVSYLKAADVAKRFGVTRRTVFSWVKTGVLPHYRIGRSIFFADSDIALLLRRTRCVGTLHSPAL